MMMSRVVQSGLLWPAVMTSIALCALIALGSWQWQRMHWKHELLRDLERAATAQPVAMQAVPTGDPQALAPDVKSLQFKRVTVTGTYLHDLQMHVWAPAPTGPAWSVVTPLRLRPPTSNGAENSSGPATHLFIIRGTVPDADKDPAVRKAGDLEGVQTVTGRIRLDQPNSWANQPNLKKNQWFTRDLKAMAARLPSPAKEAVRIAPFFLEAERAAAPPPAPQPDLKALTLSNRHFEYALTWWALAGTLFAVFTVFAAGRLTKTKT